MKTSLRSRHPLALALLLFAGLHATAAEFPQGLLLHYGFDEYPPGGVVPDKTGRGHSGRATGVKWTAMGKLAGGLDFGETNSFIAVSNAPSLNVTQVTLAVWFRTAATGASARTLIERTPATGFGLGLAEGANRGKARFVVKGAECLGDAVLTDGQWHHAAGTFDGAVLKLYVDGQLQQKTAKSAGTLEPGTHDIILGMQRSGPAPHKGPTFDGTIDEAMLFNHAITGDEVLAVMAAAKPKFSKQQVTQRLAELKDLLERGLILQEFYDRKVKECEVTPADDTKK